MKKYNLSILVILLISLITGSVNAQQNISQAGYYHLSIGDFEVIALSDGTVPVQAKELLNNDKKIPALLKKEFLSDTVETSINTYLIRTGKKLILLDAGSGNLFGSQFGGALIKSFEKAGFKPEDVTDILITHIHLDHTGGLSLDGKMIFPNATIHINQKETDFWKIHEKETAADSRGIFSNRQSYLNFKIYLDSGKVKTFKGDTTLFPGLSTHEYAGHTVGHTIYAIESKGKQLVFWGDLIHVAAVQFSGAEIPNEYDFDKVKAAVQRKKAYGQAAAGGYLVAADHISFPGIGHVRTAVNGYVWVPVNFGAEK
ncbi:MBL fold metallo-hydrolase [Pedobacter agri]|uniref:MBL fold metallo-hydrolase n=1 Tax=Pedobacter agri TaxID=454586 RepID=UPI0029302452|nr:MBL fold metallo-hydrolase [Pedobacter agri]